MRYTKRAREQLRDQLGYELWLLEYLLGQADTLRPAFATVAARIDNNGPLNAMVGSSEVLGSGRALDILAKLRLLVFLACYKVIDLTFEWVLEQNTGPQKRRLFTDKCRDLQLPGLRYPAQIARYKFIAQYILAIYINLAEYRHEVVHRRGGEALADGGVRITITKAGAAAPLGDLYMDGQQVELLASTAVLFDSLAHLHLLATFGVKEPRPIDVTVAVEESDGLFVIDLEHVRAQLDGTTITWIIPGNRIPTTSILTLPPTDLPKYRV